MSQMVNTLGGIAVECGGTVLAHAAGYSVKSSRAVMAVRPYGSTERIPCSWSRSGGRSRRILIQ